jgi:hypothetical protein
MLFGNNVGGKDLHLQSTSSRPIYGIMSYGAYGGEVEVSNVSFRKFNGGGKTKCQNRLSVFARNPNSSDKIPMHTFKNCKFEDVDDKSLAFFDNPSRRWANLKDCG